MVKGINMVLGMKAGSWILVLSTVLYALAAGFYWFEHSRPMGAMYACYGFANICAILIAEGIQ